MELDLIIYRLEKKYIVFAIVHSSYYHSIKSLLFDIDTIVSNCQLYNEDGSQLVRDVLRLREELLNALLSVHCVPSPLVLNEELPSDIQEVVVILFDRIEELLLPILPYMNKPLPPYLFTYWNRMYVVSI